MPLLETLGGIGSLIGGIAQPFIQADYNKKNLQYQKDALDYAKESQQKTWDREDNATQRRVADLKKAGLNPILAAGSAASSSAPIKVDSLNTGDVPDVGRAFRAPLEAMQIASNIATTRAQNKLINQQANKVSAETVGQELQNKNLDTQNQLMEYDLNYQRKMGVLSKATGMFGDIVNSGIGLWNAFRPNNQFGSPRTFNPFRNMGSSGKPVPSKNMIVNPRNNKPTEVRKVIKRR